MAIQVGGHTGQSPHREMATQEDGHTGRWPHREMAISTYFQTSLVNVHLFRNSVVISHNSFLHTSIIKAQMNIHYAHDHNQSKRKLIQLTYLHYEQTSGATCWRRSTMSSPWSWLFIRWTCCSERSTVCSWIFNACSSLSTDDFALSASLNYDANITTTVTELYHSTKNI